MATITKALLDLLTNPKTQNFAKSLKHSDLPDNWPKDPEIVDLAAKAWQEAGTESPFFKAWFGGSKVVDENGNPLVVYHGTDNIFDAFDDKMIASNTGNYGHYGKGHYTTTDKAEAETYGKNVIPLYMRALNPENLNISVNREKYLPDFLGMEPEVLGVSDDWIKSAVSKKYPQAEEFLNAIYKNANDDDFYDVYQAARSGGLNSDTLDNLMNFVRWNSKSLNNGSVDGSVLLDSMKLFGELPKIERGYKYVPDASYITNSGMYGADFADAVKKNGYDSVFGGGSEWVAFDPTQLKSVNNRGTFNPSDPNIYRTLAPLGLGTAAMAAALLGDGSEAEAATPQKILNYMMKHRPATVESSAPLHDLENVYPGIYNMRDRVDYKTFEPGMNDNAILNLMASVRNKPDAMVDVFRAVPKGVRDFNTGDWITLSKPYAREHGNSYLDGDFDIIKTRARAGDISNPGDSIMEQGYWGAPVKGTKTRGLLPFAAGTGAMAAALLGDGDEAKAAAINAALADPASREKAAAAGLPYDPPVEESAWSPADLLVAPVGAVGIPAKLLAMALDAPVTLGLDAGLSALGGLFGGGDRKKPGGW